MPHLGMDEKSFGRGHDYATVLLDLSRECVHEIGPERTKEATMALLTRAIPDKEQREEVSAVAMDMSAAFAAAVKETLPCAAIVYDWLLRCAQPCGAACGWRSPCGRLHVSKLLNAAVDQVRRAEHKRQSAAGNDSLKDSRYLWLTALENLSDERRTKFESVFRRNAVFGRAWTDRENLARFWECSTETEGRQCFDRWEAGLFKRKKLEPMKHHTLTNALAEGLNSLIAGLKGAARGLKNFANFRTRVFFYLGKLDLYPVTLRHGNLGRTHFSRKHRPALPKISIFEWTNYTIRQEGRPCIRGMRIRVKDVLDLLAARVPESEILKDYPYLEAADIDACLEYAD